MTTEQLLKLVAMETRIKELESIIANTKNQTCEWIVFTFGNGSNRQTVCNTPDTIEAVRKLILHENEQELALLKIEFSKL